MVEEPALKVVLVEDSPALRHLLCGMIEDIAGIEIIGEVDAEDQALRIAQRDVDDDCQHDRRRLGVGTTGQLALQPEITEACFGGEDFPFLYARLSSAAISR